MVSSPQVSKRRIDQRFLLFTIAVILLSYPFFTLRSIQDIFLYCLLIIFLIGSSFFFWLNFIPFFPKGFVDFFRLVQTIFLSFFRRTNSKYHIRAGKFDRDYFVIKNKPELGAVLNDEKSIVIVINNNGRKRVIPYGYQFIDKGEHVLHTFDLGFHHFFWGPMEIEDSQRSKIPDQDLNRTHLHSLKIAQTKFQTKDGITIIPSFSIFYNSYTNARGKLLEATALNISDYFSTHNINGELQTEINRIIGESATNSWKNLLNKSSSKEILTLTDQNSSLWYEIMLKINKIINNKNSVSASHSHESEESDQYKSINPLDQWKMLITKVYLNDLWIQQGVPQ